MDIVQTLIPWLCLDKIKNKNTGAIKIKGWVVIFLLPNVEAGKAYWVNVKGSNKCWIIPIIAIKPAASISPQERLSNLVVDIDKLFATTKLNKAVNHKSNLLMVKSILVVQNMLQVPKVKRRIKDSFKKLKLNLKSE